MSNNYDGLVRTAWIIFGFIIGAIAGSQLGAEMAGAGKLDAATAPAAAAVAAPFIK